MLDRWLVGAVRRALAPGKDCTHFGVLTIQGDPGIGKSSFFKILGGDFYLMLESKDEGAVRVQKTRAAWIVERGEVSGMFARALIQDVKQDQDHNVDTIVPKYSNDPEEVARRFVYGATDNTKELLNDPTGNRRFWILQPKKRLDRDWLIAHRDVWAYAVWLYDQGYSNILTPDEEEQVIVMSRGYQAENPWEDAVREALRVHQVEAMTAKGDPYKISTVRLMRLVGISPRDQAKERRLVKQAMGTLGWTEKPYKDGKGTVKGWVSSDRKEPEVYQF
jgi:predicted P-loop ATPase